jgi:outer membrane protein TolC
MAESCKSTAGILVALSVFMATVCPVQAQQTTVYSLGALVDSASRHLPLLLEKQALVQSAQAGITEARNSFLPQLNAVEEISVGSANDLTGPFLPMPGIIHSIAGSINAASNYQEVTGNMASLYGQYDLVTFGLKDAKVSSASAYEGVTRADLEKERYLVKWNIAKLYFAILSRRYQLAVDDEDIRRYEQMYSISKALTGSGVNPGVDSSLARAGHSRTRVSFNEATGELRRMQQQLAFYTGIASPEIAVDTGRTGVGGTGFGGAALGGTGVGGAGGFPTPGVIADTSGVPNPLEDYYAKQKQQYGAAAALARKSYLPRVIIGAGGWARGSSIQYSNVYESPGEGFGYQRLNYLAGVGVTYDLFNGVHKRDRLNVLSQQATAADYALQQQQLSLRNQQLQADESIRTAMANLNELPAQLQAATDAYNQKLAQYKAGIINLVDLVTASFELLQAQTGYIQTLNEWYTASLDKAAATGNLDQFIKTIK